MTDTQHFFVFCEGVTDIPVIFNFLKNMMAFTEKRCRFSELPLPLNKLFPVILKNQALDENIGVDDYKSTLIPHKILEREKNLVFLFNGGGSNIYKNACTLHNTYLYPTFFEGRRGHGRVHYVFFLDPDKEGLAGKKKAVDKGLKSLKGLENGFCFSGEWSSDNTDHAGHKGNVSLFILCDNPNQGTVENLLEPLLGKKKETDNAKKYMEDNFEWDASVADQAKLKKATLTAVHQREKPGKSLAAILHDKALFQNARDLPGVFGGLQAFFDGLFADDGMLR